MNIDALLAYTIALLTGIAVFSLIIGFFSNNKKLLRERQMDELIENIARSEIETEREQANLPKEKSWSGYWYRLGASAGLEQTSPHRTGLIALSIGVVGLFLGTFAWPQDVLIGFVFSVIGVVLFRMILGHNGNKRLAKIDKQLPGLLAGMRSSLSANMTPQQAILTQVGTIPAPLGDELQSLKADLDVNIPLDTALENLGQRVPSPELQFLVSSMRIAISQGANLDELLRTLQDILVARASIKDKLATAVAQAQPAIYITAVAIPLGLIFSYTSDEKNREFWFSFMGLIAFSFIAVCYVAALFMANRQVQKVKEA